MAAVVANEALEHHEAVFLATHSPIKGFDIRGSHQGDIRSADESAVLDALSAPSRKHAFASSKVSLDPANRTSSDG
ncbi:hypothetical protein HED50_22800 [Ochrobactrum oryzae]|nr:hypothetical protein [Brucella oryzae]